MNLTEGEPAVEQGKERVPEPERVDADERLLRPIIVFLDQLHALELEAGQKVAADAIDTQRRVVERVEKAQDHAPAELSTPVRLEQQQDQQHQNNDRAEEDPQRAQQDRRHRTLLAFRLRIRRFLTVVMYVSVVLQGQNACPRLR